MAESKSKTKSLLLRPPVVSILGHIDHGKTTLLDALRKSNLAAREAGGITQHIGAYQVEHQGKKITFIDTPGHAAFAKMRAHGARVTDLAILVVAADEGVKPQTKESLKYIRQAEIPFLVVLTKIDLPAADLKRVQGELAKEDVLVEEKGGQVVSVSVSAKTGKGLEDLLEMILLLAEMEELKADPQTAFAGVVIESKLDRSRGPLATVLVKNGTLSLGDTILATTTKAKVKAMFDENGQRVTQALPSQPVEVLGFQSVPPVGSLVTPFRAESIPIAPSQPQKTSPSPPEDEKSPKLRIILKADTQGTLEAVAVNLPDQVEIIAQDVGDLNESDILLSQTTRAQIFGFNVKISSQVKKLAQTEKVKIKTFRLIYELLEEIKDQLSKILKPPIEEEILGEAKILKEFTLEEGKIAGAQVLKGRIAPKDQIRLKRGDKILGESQVKSLKIGAKKAAKAKAEEEFGAFLEPQLDFKPGDMLVSFRKLPSRK